MIDYQALDALYNSLDVGDYVLTAGSSMQVGVVKKIISAEEFILASPVKIGHSERYCSARFTIKIYEAQVFKWFARNQGYTQDLNDVTSSRVIALRQDIIERSKT